MSFNYRPLPRGLALFNGMRTAAATASVIDAMSLRWSTIQPTPGAPDLTRAKAALAAAEKAGMTGCDLRVFAGIYAPTWLSGQVGAVPYADGQDGTKGNAVQFWQPATVQAWLALQTAMAAELGPNPLLRSVTHSLPMTVYAESFMRGDAASRKALAAAGLTDEADLAVHKAGIDIHAAVWAPLGVRLRIALNPWVSAASGHADVERLRQVIDYAIATLGQSGVILQNNSIRSPGLRGLYPAMYDLMETYRQAGTPIGFQTASDARIGDIEATVRWAISRGAHWVEPAPSSWSKLSSVTLNELAGALSTNAAAWDLTPLQEATLQVEALRAQVGTLQAQVGALQGQLTSSQGQVASLQASLTSEQAARLLSDGRVTAALAALTS